MTGPQPAPDEWTVSILREHLTTRIDLESRRIAELVEGLSRLTDAKFVTFRTLMDGQAEKTALALTASKEAIDKAEKSTQKAIDKTAADVAQRFESVNEFRGQQRDVIATFIPRAEAEQRIAAVVEKIEDLVHARTTDLGVMRDTADRLSAGVDARLKALEQGASNMQGRLWALGTVFAFVVILVNIATRFI